MPGRISGGRAAGNPSRQGGIAETDAELEWRKTNESGTNVWCE